MHRTMITSMLAGTAMTLSLAAPGWAWAQYGYDDADDTLNRHADLGNRGQRQGRAGHRITARRSNIDGFGLARGRDRFGRVASAAGREHAGHRPQPRAVVLRAAKHDFRCLDVRARAVAARSRSW